MAKKAPSKYRAMRHLRKGGLHRALGLAEGSKIPAARVDKAKGSKNAHVAEMAGFAPSMEGMVDAQPDSGQANQ